MTSRDNCPGSPPSSVGDGLDMPIWNVVDGWVGGAEDLGDERDKVQVLAPPEGFVWCSWCDLHRMRRSPYILAARSTGAEAGGPADSVAGRTAKRAAPPSWAGHPSGPSRDGHRQKAAFGSASVSASDAGDRSLCACSTGLSGSASPSTLALWATASVASRLSRRRHAGHVVGQNGLVIGRQRLIPPLAPARRCSEPQGPEAGRAPVGCPEGPSESERGCDPCCVEILFRLPFSVTMTGIRSASITSVRRLRTRLGRPFGLPDCPGLKRECSGGLR